MIMTIISLGFLIVAILTTIYLKFPQFKVFKYLRKYQQRSPNPQENKKALFVTLATNLGAGNLVGIAAAIALGGPGVIIWMWIFGFFSSAFALWENSYSVKYQDLINGEKRSGACFYILKGLKKPWLSLVFAVFLILTNTIFFPPIQINTIVGAIINIKEVPIILVGVGLIISLGLIVFRGTQKIIKASEKIVIFMTYTFVIVVTFLIIVNYQLLPKTIQIIFKEAFSFQAIGWAGFINLIGLGIRRSLFSHEAGLGTVPSIAGMGDDQDCLAQGYFQMLAVYVDTLFLCTLTGILIVMISPDFNVVASNQVIVFIIKNQLGNIGLVIGSLFLFIFAFASVMGQYYLGESNAMFFTKITKIKPKTIKIGYQLIYLSGIMIGLIVSTSQALELVDLAMLSIGAINLVVLFTLEKREKWLHKKIENDIM